MTFLLNTLTDGNAASVLAGSIDTALIANGYVLVDTVVITTLTHKVYKNPASNNVSGLDWFVVISYPTTGVGNIDIIPMEYYDPATHLAYRVVNSESSSALETTYYSKYGATGYALNAAQLAIKPGASNNFYLSTAATSFAYWISITKDRILGMTSQINNKVLYVGVYTPDSEYSSYCGSALFPLIACSILNDGLAQSKAITRAPKLQLNTMPRWDIIPTVEGEYGTQGSASIGPRIPDGPPDATGKQYATLYRVSGASYSNGATDGRTAGVYGRLKDVAFTHGASTVTQGSTVTIAGETWYVSAPANGSYSSGLVLFRGV